ncbi:hypothetical protein H2203_000748 [Taxawa tesnikishii (nom. ined.)]|nr:hypothetical protein H2203_000748 [Dothideales sp. JES 119]
MAKQQFGQLRAAAIDGRTQTIYYRQAQLEKLYETLVENATSIQEVIVTDTGVSQAEARIEYSLALSSLREQYAQLDPLKEHEEEYLIREGRNAPSLRTGVGIVYIKPTTHTLFFSVISPLSAAIAAGNCVLLQLENNLREVSGLLRKLLKDCLDPSTFEIAQEVVTETTFLDSCVQVVQDGINQIVSTPKALTFAVVDRTANLDNAARALVNARFAFGGRSPYAPDVVLVNEFVKKDFLQALVRQTIGVGEDGALANGALTKHNKKVQGLKGFLSNMQKEAGVRIITQEDSGAIIDVQQRSAKILQNKVNEACLIVHSIRSLDDAIDLANRGDRLLAGYHFASPAQGKYLSQFIAAQVSFVNHIPSELFVGPAAPINHGFDATFRYPAELFSEPAPAFITPSPQASTVFSALAGPPAERTLALRNLTQNATAALPVVRKRANDGMIGYFEQGFLVHLGLSVVATIATIGGGIWWLRNRR